MFTDQVSGRQLRLLPRISLWLENKFAFNVIAAIKTFDVISYLVIVVLFYIVLHTSMTNDVPTPTRFNIFCPQLDNPRFNKVFCRRFRMPYESFKMLAAVAEHELLFKKWKEGAVDVSRQPATPLHLGHGWTFDDLSEKTGISEEDICVFFHALITYRSTKLYQQHVVSPRTANEAAIHTEEYSRAGLPGCVGSCDATHIVFEKKIEC
jgi:hypothetical protein